MEDLILYLALALVGYIIGSKIKVPKEKLAWTGKLQTAAIGVLVLSMGLRMGANREVIKNIGSIGIYALVMTFFVMLFAILATSIIRRAMGLDRYGMLKGEVLEEKIEQNSDSGKAVNVMTIIIVVAVFAGMLVGYIASKTLIKDFVSYDNFMGILIKLGLCVLLLFVGVDLGMDGTVIEHFKRVGIRVLAIPVAVVLGSLIGAGVCSILLPLSLKESLAIGAGLGWYSLAPGIILESGFAVASAISFIHNVLRELVSLVFVPIIAKKIGFVETVALPGAAAMDVCLPIVEKSTRSEIAVFSFVSGVVLSAAVPILVPLMLTLN